MDMITTRSNAAQLSFIDLWLPAELRGLPKELAIVDSFLDDEDFLSPYRAHFDPIYGRPSIPIETYLRMMYLKHRYNLGYETLVKEVSDSISWRRFCRIGITEQVPHPTTLSKITHRVGPEVVKKLNKKLLKKARSQKLIRSKTLRADTTVIEADVSYPTDAGLLARAVGAIGRAVRAIKKSGGATRTAFRDRSRAAGKRMREITGSLKARSGEKKERVNHLTKELSSIAAISVKDAEALLKNAARALRADPTNGRLCRAISDLKVLLGRALRVLEQTGLRLKGQTSIPDRLISLSDPDARPIKKGKLSAPTEFGYKTMYADGKEGFVEDYDVYVGNPNDEQLLSAVVDSYIEQTGEAPAAVTADRGFGSQATEDEIKEKGVSTVVIPRRGKTTPERKEVESRPHFKRLVKWRTGAEGRISCLKRRGSRRSRLKGKDGAKTWVGFGVLSHNLDKVVTCKKKRE